MVKIASTFSEAATFIRHKQVDLVFVDTGIFLKDGLDLLPVLMDEQRPIIFTSANHTEIYEPLKAADLNYLAHPVTVEALEICAGKIAQISIESIREQNKLIAEMLLSYSKRSA